MEPDPQQNQGELGNSLPSWLRWLLAPILRIIRRSQVLQKVIANTGWLFVERGISMAITFSVSVWLVRYLGPELFGKYSYAASLIGLFGALASLGLDNIVIRNIVRGDAREGELLATTGLLKFVGGGVATGLAVGTAMLLGQDHETTLLVGLFGAGVIFASLSVPDLWFQAHLQSKYSVAARVGSQILTAAAKIGLILAGASLVAFAVLAPIGALLTGLALLVLLRIKAPTTIQFRVRVDLIIDLLRDSWPLIIAGLSVAVYMKIDQIMLGEMTNDREVGLYATAVRLSEMWYFLPVVIAGSVFPAIIESKENASVEVYRQRMQTLYDLMAAITYSVAIPVTVLAAPIVVLLFGDEYRDSAAILQVHIWAFHFVALGVSRAKWLIAENMTRFSMIATLIGAVVNVVLNVFLVPGYGGLGAAWATLIAYAISAYLSSLFLARTRLSFVQMTRGLLLPFRFKELRHGLSELAK